MDSAVQRNARTIARAQSFRDDEQNRRREELQRRIEETRKKLQNVGRHTNNLLYFFSARTSYVIIPFLSLEQIGYRSTMRGSQSISDLSMTPDPSMQNNLRGSGVSGKGKETVDNCH